jgi:hypothetical protein
MTDAEIQRCLTKARRLLGRVELELCHRLDHDREFFKTEAARGRWKPLHSMVRRAYQAAGTAESKAGTTL